MAFVASPRARYCHQIGGKFALELLELVVRRLTKDCCQCDMGHLGLDGLGRFRIKHGDGVILNWSMQVGKGEVSWLSQEQLLLVLGKNWKIPLSRGP